MHFVDTWLGGGPHLMGAWGGGVTTMPAFTRGMVPALPDRPGTHATHCGRNVPGARAIPATGATGQVENLESGEAQAIPGRHPRSSWSRANQLLQLFGLILLESKAPGLRPGLFLPQLVGSPHPVPTGRLSESRVPTQEDP